MGREWLRAVAMVALVSGGTILMLQANTALAVCPDNKCDKKHSLVSDNALECPDCWETVTETWTEVCKPAGAGADRQCDPYAAVIESVKTYDCNGLNECELQSVTTTPGTRCNTNACP